MKGVRGPFLVPIVGWPSTNWPSTWPLPFLCSGHQGKKRKDGEVVKMLLIYKERRDHDKFMKGSCIISRKYVTRLVQFHKSRFSLKTYCSWNCSGMLFPIKRNEVWTVYQLFFISSPTFARLIRRPVRLWWKLVFFDKKDKNVWVYLRDHSGSGRKLIKITIGQNWGCTLVQSL